MFCRKCGQLLSDGDTFCGTCETPVFNPSNRSVVNTNSSIQQDPIASNLVPDYTNQDYSANKYSQQPAVKIIPSAAGRRETVEDTSIRLADERMAMLMGILSLAFLWSVVGSLVLGITGLKVSKRYNDKYYEMSPKVLKGRKMSLISLIISLSIIGIYILGIVISFLMEISKF